MYTIFYYDEKNGWWSEYLSFGTLKGAKRRIAKKRKEGSLQCACYIRNSISNRIEKSYPAI